MRLKQLLLDILSTHRDVFPEQIAQLTDAQWQRILAMAAEHRVEPLLYWRFIQERKFPVPEPVAQRLKHCFRQESFKRLRQMGQLVRIVRLLSHADIPYVALKGSQLLGMYPHHALRVMRDLDILIPATHIRTAYQRLREQGYFHPEGYERDIDAHIQFNKHLPNMVDPSGQIMIELHIRVLHPDDFPQQDLSDEPGFWQRTQTVTLANQQMKVMSNTDLLLHLIIHGCYDHHFNNGPLLFTDIFYLLQSQSVDWSLFWSMAEKRRATDGCILVLSMVAYYHGEQPVQWPASLSSQRENLTRQIPEFSVLTLQNYVLRGSQTGLTLFYQQTSWWGKLGLLGKKLFPSRQAMGIKYPVNAGSRKVWGYYPYHWIRLMSQLPDYWRLKQSETAVHQARQVAKLKRQLDRGSK